MPAQEGEAQTLDVPGVSSATGSADDGSSHLVECVGGETLDVKPIEDDGRLGQASYHFER